MNAIDWSVVGVYIAGMVFMSWWLGRKQTDMQGYYLGGNNMSWWAIGISTMATQCSTNSLLGAPAFIITVGLLWLQYEFAVPVAMVVIMVLLLPFYRKLNLVSIYEYLERRFGKGTRTTLSVVFQFLRAFGTGVPRRTSRASSITAASPSRSTTSAIGPGITPSWSPTPW